MRSLGPGSAGIGRNERSQCGHEPLSDGYQKKKMGNTITKADLANTLFDELGLNKREAKEFVELFFEKIRQALESGETVKLSGFGGFSIREKNSRPGRNPKTGEAVPVCARRVVTYRASQKVKDQVGANTDHIESVASGERVIS